MHCVRCEGATRIIDSRPDRIEDVDGPRGQATRRRHVCQACGHRFTTYETIVDVRGYVRHLAKHREINAAQRADPVKREIHKVRQRAKRYAVKHGVNRRLTMRRMFREAQLAGKIPKDVECIW